MRRSILFVKADDRELYVRALCVLEKQERTIIRIDVSQVTDESELLDKIDTSFVTPSETANWVSVLAIDCPFVLFILINLMPVNADVLTPSKEEVS